MKDEESSVFLVDLSKVYFSNVLFLLVWYWLIISLSDYYVLFIKDRLVVVCFLSRSLKLGYFLIPYSYVLIISRATACYLKVSRYISSISVSGEVFVKRSFIYFYVLVFMKGLFKTSIIVGLSWGFFASMECIKSLSCFEYVGMMEG